MDAALLRRVEQQRVAMLYGNTAAVSGSAVLMAVLMVIIAWPDVSGLTIALWCTGVLLVQAGVQWLTFAYRRAANAQAEPRLWGMRLANAAFIAGLVWGSAAFVLVGPNQSLALALISACLASRATISIMTHAYFPPALHSFAVPVFGLLAVRYVFEGGYRNAALGVLWIAVLGYVLLFVERQARAVATQIRLRIENEQLVDELKRQNTLAEEARVRAEEASRSKSRFFAAANHDLRQPLHSLGLFATALRNGSAGRSGIKLVDQILLCTESLEQLFDNLLDISRLDAGQVQVKREAVPADQVLDRLRSTFLVPAQEKGLRLRVRRSGDILATDSTLLFRMLSNFVSNAIRYTNDGGVLVACRKRGKKLLVEVWDTGVGIPPDQHERIFEEFYQINNPERDRTRGLGLGLATVRRISTLLDHPLTLDSRPGRGSRFSIEVPLADAQRAPSVTATVEQKVPNLLRGKLIVVVDDEASVRLGMQSLLESWGCRCVTAMDASEALSALGSDIPDFIIADLRLRGEDTGIEVIRTLRAQLGESLPAVLISGDTATEQLRKVSTAGLTIMHKPLKAVRLRALLNHEFARQGREVLAEAAKA
ncbi:hybrid sensor histidine kinase/response regulator [Povalibacter sp.]|uniref:hybrid sensor histidine kinase/response regulator n=1 Tax=Povalibacter sp. TaxID=1962978 RepID=UPI002F4274EB